MGGRAGPYKSGVADGSGNANLDTPVPVSGRIVAIHAESEVGCLTGLTLTVSMKDPSMPILVDASVAEGWWYPATVTNLNTSGAAIANEYQRGVPVDGFLNIAIAGGEEGDQVLVTLILE